MKFKYCLFVTILCFFLTALSTLMRIMITYDTIEKEHEYEVTLDELEKEAKEQGLDIPDRKSLLRQLSQGAFKSVTGSSSS